MVTAYELLDIALSVGNRIDMQWGLFITVHLAIFGGIIYVDRPLWSLEKVGALLIYFPFAVLNFRITRLQMDLLQTAYRDIAKMADDNCCVSSELVANIASHVASDRFGFADSIVIGGHVLVAFLVVMSIVFDRAISSRIHRESKLSSEAAVKE